MCGTPKTVMTGKFMSLYVYIRNEVKSQSNDLCLNLKNLHKEKQPKPKASRKNEWKSMKLKTEKRNLYSLKS